VRALVRSGFGRTTCAGRPSGDVRDGGAVGGQEREAQDGADRADDAAGAGAVHHARHLRRRPGARPAHHLRRLGPRQGTRASSTPACISRSTVTSMNEWKLFDGMLLQRPLVRTGLRRCILACVPLTSS